MLCLVDVLDCCAVVESTVEYCIAAVSQKIVDKEVKAGSQNIGGRKDGNVSQRVGRLVSQMKQDEVGVTRCVCVFNHRTSHAHACMHAPR